MSKKLKLLIVDDIEINRLIISELFSEKYDVIEAQNGKEALEVMDGEPEIAIVLLDIVMPVMDGFGVLKAMNESGKINSIPVIIITGREDDEMALESYSLGVSDVIHKPFNAAIVNQRVTNVINLYVYKNDIEEQLVGLKRETSIAKDIQNSILPVNDEYLNIIGINAEYLPVGDLGGDVYDLVKLSDNEVLVYIADVAGHGIQASLLTIYLRENIRANASAAQKSLGALVKKLLASYQALDIDAAMYIGLLLCKYNKKKKELSILNVGHNCYPLVIRRDGAVEEVVVRGMPISKFNGGDTNDPESVGVYQGDRLLLFTDGLAEEHDFPKQETFGAEGVRNVAAEYHHLPGRELAKKIIGEAEKFTAGEAKDDRTVVIADIL
ncbi:MAG: fused response regulator/phosphatase [Clostridiales Family XIII bacterium]|nr:fused response regulator/phosphatase [Clostridiales Family XIII bacterium]